MRLRVTPIEGWGWYGADGRLETLPPPFEFDAVSIGGDAFLVVGQCDEPEHPLFGIWVRLSQRHTDWDGVCVVSATESADGPGHDKGALRLSGMVDVEIISAG